MQNIQVCGGINLLLLHQACLHQALQSQGQVRRKASCATSVTALSGTKGLPNAHADAVMLPEFRLI